MSDVPMPWAGFHCASEPETAQGRARMHLAPDFLVPDGVALFFRDRVAPLIIEGVDGYLFHAPFGKTVEYRSPLYPNAISDSGDMRFGMYEVMSQSANALHRKHAYQMRNMIKGLASLKRLQIQLYYGTLRCPSLNQLAVDGDLGRWYRLVHHSIAPFVEHDNIGFIIDAIGSKHTHAESRQWKAYTMLEAFVGADRMCMEALPHPDQPHLWGRRSMALEGSAQHQLKGYGAMEPGDLGTVGEVVYRFFDSRRYLRQVEGESAPIWPVEDGGFSSFVADCHVRGEREGRRYVAVLPDHLVKREGLSFGLIRDEAQGRVDGGEG